MNPLSADIPTTLAPFLTGGAPSAPIIVVGVIAMVVGVGLWCQFSLWRRYQRASAMLREARAKLSGSISFGNVHVAVRVACGAAPQDAGKLLMDYVERAARRGAEFQSASAVEITSERERQLWRAAFVRWVTGTALVMGLSGTFVAFTQLVTGSGLMEALRSLHDTAPDTGASLIPGNSYVQLSVAFTKVYAGFGYAFLASLAGLVGTMALGFVGTLFVARALAHCLAHMEDFGEDILRPLLSQTGPQINNLGDVLKGAAAMLDTSAQTMKALRQTSIVLDRAAHRFEESQGANSEMVNTLGKLATELDTSRQRWDTLLDALRESRANMARTVEEFQKEAAAQRELTNASTAEAVRGMRAVVLDMAEQIKQVSAAKADHFASVQSDVQRMLVDSKKDWDRVSAGLLGKTDEAFKLSLAAVQGAVAEGRRDAASAQLEIASLARETSSAVTAHEKVLAAHSQAVVDSMINWSDTPAQVAAAVEAGRVALDKLTLTLGTLNDMPAQWENRVLGSIERLDARLEESNGRLDRRVRLGRWWQDLRARLGGRGQR